jgi:hypothetical protein
MSCFHYAILVGYAMLIRRSLTRALRHAIVNSFLCVFQVQAGIIEVAMKPL